MNYNQLVSIVLPVFNGEKYLASSIESCLNQSYDNFELIIVDDCSNDSSFDIAKEFEKKDKRILVVSNSKNLKLPATLNIGHRLAKGDFVTWTSHDNKLKLNFLETLVKTLTNNEVDLVYSDYEIINEDNNLKRIHHAGPTEHLLFANKIGASFLYKRIVFEELDGYDESLHLIEDYDFWLRAAMRFKFYYLNDNLYQYRIHSKSLTSKIKKNNTANKKYEEGLLRMIDKFSEQYLWSKLTSNFLLENILGRKMDLIKYLENKKLIEKDILRFNPKMFNDKKIINGFFLVLRNELITNHCNFKALIKVLRKEKSLLFHPSFSKKSTYNYIVNAIIK